MPYTNHEPMTIADEKIRHIASAFNTFLACTTNMIMQRLREPNIIRTHILVWWIHFAPSSAPRIKLKIQLTRAIRLVYSDVCFELWTRTHCVAAKWSTIVLTPQQNGKIRTCLKQGASVFDESAAFSETFAHKWQPIELPTLIIMRII